MLKTRLAIVCCLWASVLVGMWWAYSGAVPPTTTIPVVIPQATGAVMTDVDAARIVMDLIKNRDVTALSAYKDVDLLDGPTSLKYSEAVLQTWPSMRGQPITDEQVDELTNPQKAALYMSCLRWYHKYALKKVRSQAVAEYQQGLIDDADAESQTDLGADPTADAGGPYTGTAGSPVALTGAASSDPDGTIAAYAWDTGDSGSETGETPSHTYASPGEYTVTLTVTDDDGLTDYASTTATITAAP